MEEGLQLRDEKSMLEKLPEKEFLMCKTLHRMNQLRSYKLGVIEILEWKDTLVKLLPDIDVKVIEFVIDKLILGELDYDANLGIKNIIIGIRKVEISETGELKVKPYRPW